MRCVLAVALLCAACPSDDGPVASEDTTTSGADSTSTATTTDTSSTTGSVDESSSTGSSGGPPPTPMLLSPADGAIDVAVETELCWEPVVDPDGDAVRYRVFLDDIELNPPAPGQPGFAGPCTSVLLFDVQQTYRWQVQAFETADPTSESAVSDAFEFTTIADPFVQTVFEDRFDDDLGWEISGDAMSGAWVRGNPVPTSWFDTRAQPGECAGGQSCMFTGQNPDSIVDEADVAGGATVLLSPPFDLSGAAAATVELGRFYFESTDDPDTWLRIELLVPDAGRPGGYAAFVLEELDDAATTDGANLWHAREYAACEVPYAAGSRLRITASDGGDGIVEAAIDTVAVRAHVNAEVCGAGLGAQCDPSLGAAACSDGSSCCAQGVVQRGVYRCSSPVAGLDYDAPPADPGDPGNGPLGCDGPDVFADPTYFEPFTTEIMVAPDSCLLFEGCVDGPGLRRILLFTTVTPNVGSRDLALGVPPNQPDLFHYSACHDHHHFDHYASYELRDGEGLVQTGHKQAFCLEDTFSWAWPLEPPTFDCTNQGISRGFGDIYDAALPCQWVDITDVPAGDYTLRVELNVVPPDAAARVLVERDYDNNATEIPVTIE